MHASQNHSPSVGIVILNWNKADETIGCLEAVAKLTYRNYRVVLIENGSHDDSLVRLRAHFPELEIIALVKNVGYGRAVNVGLRALQAHGVDYTLQLDNDARPAADLLERLVAVMEADPQLGIVSPIIYRRDVPAMIATIGGKMEPRRVVSLSDNEPDHGQYASQDLVALDFVYGCGLFARRRVLDEIGLLDPRFFLYYEDIDLCTRVRQRGYRIACVPSAHLWHQGSVSAQGAHYHKDFFYAQSRIRFFRKHLPSGDYLRFVLAELPYLISIGLRRIGRRDWRGAKAYLGGAVRELLLPQRPQPDDQPAISAS